MAPMAQDSKNLSDLSAPLPDSTWQFVAPYMVKQEFDDIPDTLVWNTDQKSRNLRQPSLLDVWL